MCPWLTNTVKSRRREAMSRQLTCHSSLAPTGFFLQLTRRADPVVPALAGMRRVRPLVVTEVRASPPSDRAELRIASHVRRELVTRRGENGGTATHRDCRVWPR